MECVFSSLDDLYEDNTLDDLPESRAKACLEKGDIPGFQSIFERLPRPLGGSSTLRLLGSGINAPLSLLQDIWAAGTPLTKYDWSCYIFLLESAIEQDRADVLAWLQSCLFPSEDALQGILELAFLEGSLSCVEMLLPKKQQWEATEPILLSWAYQHMGNPTFDACVAAVAPYLLSEPWNKEEKTPYHPMITLEFLLNCSKKNGDTLSLCNHYINHCIAQGDLSPLQINQLVNSLIMVSRNLMDGDQTPYSPYIQMKLGKHCVHHNLSIPPLTFGQVAATLDTLLTSHPKAFKQWHVRSLVAALALVNHPQPQILAWAQKLTGKVLVIMDYHMPWVDRTYSQGIDSEKELPLEDNLLSRWSQRMPKGLSPAISFERFPHFTKCQPYLDVCRVVGRPPAHRLSYLARAILRLESDNPHFLNALAPGGVLHQERINYLKWLAEEGEEHHVHYLTTLTLLQEGKHYDL